MTTHHATAPVRNLPDPNHHVKPRAVETIDFHGVTIEALPPNGDGKVWISVRHVCDALGIDPDGQRVKLSTKEWACTEIISVQLPGSSQTRALTCIDLDSLPLWLATIEASRVKPAVRPLLLAFQKECARVLRDHFFGAPVKRPRPVSLRHAPEPEASTSELPAWQLDRIARGNRTLRPGLPNDTVNAARPLLEAASRLYLHYGHRRGELGTNAVDATPEERAAVEAADLHDIGTLAEQLAAEVRRRWPAMVGLLTVRRLPRARQHALALASVA